jgi:uncharacterized RDD family membrane protein YckC
LELHWCYAHVVDLQPTVHDRNSTTESAVIYAGFWQRFIAAIIDFCVLFLPFCFVLFVLTVVAKLSTSVVRSGQWPIALAVPPLSAALVTWLYFGLMESSPAQATVGKMFLKLRVTDDSGQRLSFGRATLRTLAKYVSSSILGVGFLMCGFSRRKQALHDLIAKCVVLRVRT